MIVQCPKCGVRCLFDEERIAGHTSILVRCYRCQNQFAVLAAAASPLASAEPAAEATRMARPGDSAYLPPGKTVALSVTEGSLKGEVFRLTKARVVVGRQGADIVLNDPQISRKHCALEMHGITATLVDLSTMNGTFVNEQKIQSCELEHLSEFRIGTTKLLFTVTDEE